MRKNALIMVLMIVCLAPTYSQTIKGKMMLGGGISAYSAKDNSQPDFKESFTQVSPSLGYFVADNLAVGLNIFYSQQKEEDTGFETDDTGFGFGPFLRYYKYTSNESFAFFFQGGFNIHSLKQNGSSGGVDFPEVKAGLTEIYVRPGIAFLINDHWSVELGFSGILYQSYDPNKDVDDDKETYFIVGLNSFIDSPNSFNPIGLLVPSTLGFRYHFGGGD